MRVSGILPVIRGWKTILPSTSRTKPQLKTPVSSPSQLRRNLPKSAGSRRTPTNVSFTSAGRVKSATVSSSSKSTVSQADNKNISGTQKKDPDLIVESVPIFRPQPRPRPASVRRSTLPLTKDWDFPVFRSHNYIGLRPAYNRYYRGHSNPELVALAGKVPTNEVSNQNEQSNRTASLAPPTPKGWFRGKQYQAHVLQRKNELAKRITKVMQELNNNFSIQDHDELESQEDALEVLEYPEDLWEEGVRVQPKAGVRVQPSSKQTKPHRVPDYAYCPRCSLLVSTGDTPLKIIHEDNDRPSYHVHQHHTNYQQPVIRVSKPESQASDDQLDNTSHTDSLVPWPANRAVELTVPRSRSPQSVTSLVTSRGPSSVVHDRALSPVIRHFPSYSYVDQAITADLFRSSTPMRSRSCSPRPPVVKHLCTKEDGSYRYVDAEDMLKLHSRGWKAYEGYASDEE